MTATCRIGRVRFKALANVVALPVVTPLDSDPALMLAAAMERGLDSVVIAGWDRDGSEYFRASMGDGGEALWLLERCKAALLHG